MVLKTKKRRTGGNLLFFYKIQYLPYIFRICWEGGKGFFLSLFVVGKSFYNISENPPKGLLNILLLGPFLFGGRESRERFWGSCCILIYLFELFLEVTPKVCWIFTMFTYTLCQSMEVVRCFYNWISGMEGWMFLLLRLGPSNFAQLFLTSKVESINLLSLI